MAKTTSNRSHGFVELLKFIAFVALIPTIAAVTISFLKEITELKTAYHHAFKWGMFVYTLTCFFVSDFAWLYRFGQGMCAEMFKLWSSLSKVMPYIFPIYTVLTVLLYYFVVRILHFETNQAWWFFVIGFTFAMHLVMTAHELYEADNSLFKPNYFFDMTLVYILDIFLMVQLLNAAAWKFSVVAFALTVFDLTRNFYQLIYVRFF